MLTQTSPLCIACYCDLRGLRYPVPPLTKEASCMLFISASQPARKSCAKHSWLLLRKSHLGEGGNGSPAWGSIKQLRQEPVKPQNSHRTSEHETHWGIFQETGSQTQPKNEKRGREMRERKKPALLFQFVFFEKHPSFPATIEQFNFPLKLKWKGEEREWCDWWGFMF